MVNTTEISLPLNNVQLELMKLFSTGLSDSELAELKEVLVEFLIDKGIQQKD